MRLSTLIAISAILFFALRWAADAMGEHSPLLWGGLVAAGAFLLAKHWLNS